MTEAMTRTQADQITAAFNNDEIQIEVLEDIVRKQIAGCGNCSPILEPMKTALVINTDEAKEYAAHAIRSIWRVCQWKYSEASRVWLRMNIDPRRK